MIPMKRFESILGSLGCAAEKNDKISQYRLILALLRLLIEQHKILETQLAEITRLSRAVNHTTVVPTVYADSTTYHRRGWGASSSSKCSGHSGDRLRPVCEITPADKQAERTQLAAMQRKYNESLTLLQQYAAEFAVQRDVVMKLKPDNISQRNCQNVLYVSDPNLACNRSKNLNPLYGVIAAAMLGYTVNITSPTVMLNAKKGKIGRMSQNDGMRLFRTETSRPNRGQHYSPERYTGGKSKAVRLNNVTEYVIHSARYKDLADWIVGLHGVPNLVKVMRHIPGWKEKHEATNRLAYYTAASRIPYVGTIVSSRPEQVATVRYLQHDVPVYRSECICWDSSAPTQIVYYLGKTGSVVIDQQLATVDWMHVGITDPVVDVVSIFERRLSPILALKHTEAQRRKETATYARKLVRLETISMLDSKNAGNCLPGTIQFAREMGIRPPEAWNDFKVDCRELLRAWKSKSYKANRLFYLAIDEAWKRVTRQVVSVGAFW